jgi:hypothetical protein
MILTVLQETFNIDGDHFWMETWGVMEAKQLLLEMHRPTSTMKDPNSKRYYVCQHFGFKGQKHHLNLYRNHGLCRAEAVKGVHLKSYPTIPWANTISSTRSLSHCNTMEDVLHMFRDVKLRGSKRGTGVALAADSLVNSVRTEQAPKRVAESKAQSDPPKKSGANLAARKRGLRPPKEQLLSQHRIEYFPTMFQILL